MPERTSRPFGPERTSPPLAPEQPADPVHDGPAGAADLEVQVVPRAAHSRVRGSRAARAAAIPVPEPTTNRSTVVSVTGSPAGIVVLGAVTLMTVGAHGTRGEVAS